MRDQRKLKRLRGGYSIFNWKPPTKDPETGKWEKHVPLANYEGPGTRVRWRLANKIPPTTQTDAGAMRHDIDYANIGTKLKKGQITRQQAIQQVRQSDARLVKTGLRNLASPWPVEKIHAAAAASGIIGKQALQQAGLLDELKFIDPESAKEDEIEIVGQGKIRRKRKPKKVDRLKELRKRFKKNLKM
jgi:hypothetical protein